MPNRRRTDGPRVEITRSECFAEQLLKMLPEDKTSVQNEQEAWRFAAAWFVQEFDGWWLEAAREE